MKAQTIEGPVGPNPVCCHPERSEESLHGFAYGNDRDREILRFAQNDSRLGVGDCGSIARFRTGGPAFVLKLGCSVLDDFQGWGNDESADH
jgi:hypothetical protein